MYLVDTSVWIDYLQGKTAAHVEFLDRLLDNPLALGLSDAIYLKILQGAKDAAAFERLKKYFGSQHFYGFADSRLAHEAAAGLYQDCRRQGVTIRSTLDCLIAQCAIENGLILLHHDRDYLNLQAVVPSFRQQHFLILG